MCHKEWGQHQGKFTHCPRGPTRSLGPGGASPGPGLLPTPCMQRSSPRYWTRRRVPLGGRCRSVPYCEFGRRSWPLRRRERSFARCWAVALALFHWNAEFADSWSLRGRQWWWSAPSITFYRAGEHHPRCHQWRGWQASGELGDAADVWLWRPLSSCAENLPGNEILN